MGLNPYARTESQLVPKKRRTEPKGTLILCTEYHKDYIGENEG